MRYLHVQRRHRDVRGVACEAHTALPSAPSRAPSLLSRYAHGGQRARRRLLGVVCVGLVVLVLLLLFGVTRMTRWARGGGRGRAGADGRDRVGDAAPSSRRLSRSLFVPCRYDTPRGVDLRPRDGGDVAHADAAVWLDAQNHLYVRLNTTTTTATMRNDAAGAQAGQMCYVRPPIYFRDRAKVRARATDKPAKVAADKADDAAAVVHDGDGDGDNEDDRGGGGAGIDEDDDDDARWGGNAYHKWYGLLRPTQAYTMPDFATPLERDTLEHASIFVSVAAYRDEECRTTVLSALRMARGRHRLYFGISEELLLPPSSSSSSPPPRPTATTGSHKSGEKGNHTHTHNTTAAAVDDDNEDDDDVGHIDEALLNMSCISALLQYTEEQQAAALASRDDVTQQPTTTTTTTTTRTPTTTTMHDGAAQSPPPPPPPLSLSDAQQQRLRRLLYDDDAPSSLTFSLRPLTWSRIAASRGGMTTSIAAFAPNATAALREAPPTRVYIHPSTRHDRLLCIAGDVETVRDRYILQRHAAERTNVDNNTRNHHHHHHDNSRNHNSSRHHNATTDGHAPSSPRPRPRTVLRGHAVRYGRGGAQERPSTALAGCRVTTRLSSHKRARGPIYSRYLTSLLYHNQDYMLIVDSHTRFVRDWDAKMIRGVFKLPTRGVLSHYPNGYTPAHPTAEYKSKHVMLMCFAVLRNSDDFMPQLGATWQRLGPRPILDAFVAGGFLFGDAQFVLDVPFDPLLSYVFVGEEALYSSRLWTSGWDMYTPMEVVVLHNYERDRAPRYWSTMMSDEYDARRHAEWRAVYFMRRPTPWVVVKASLEATTTDKATQQRVEAKEEAAAKTASPSPSPERDTERDNHTTLTPTPTPAPYVDVEERLLVRDDAAAALWPLAALASYYGQGTRRRLDDYWHFAQLTDDYIHTRDSEYRLEGGKGLCNVSA